MCNFCAVYLNALSAESGNRPPEHQYLLLCLSPSVEDAQLYTKEEENGKEEI